MCEKLVSKLSLCQRKSVAKRLLDSVLAKSQIFLNETRWARLEKGNN